MRWRYLISLVLIAVFFLSCAPPTPTPTPPSANTLEVNATLNGSPWSGQLQYKLDRPDETSWFDSVPKTLTVNPDTWTCTYLSGGPGNFVNITPSPTQTLPSGGTITFTINFTTPPPTPITIRLEAKKDAEVREYTPDTNYGSALEMWVAPWGPHPDSRKHRTYVWFSLAPLPAGATVQSATLYLYHSGFYGVGTHTNAAYHVTDVWEEMIITWNNQPPSAPNPTDDISFNIAETGVWRSWDVTPDIDAMAIENGWVDRKSVV